MPRVSSQLSVRCVQVAGGGQDTDHARVREHRAVARLSDPHARRQLDIIRRSTERMEHMIRDLLDLAIHMVREEQTEVVRAEEAGSERFGAGFLQIDSSAERTERVGQQFPRAIALINDHQHDLAGRGQLGGLDRLLDFSGVGRRDRRRDRGDRDRRRGTQSQEVGGQFSQAKAAERQPFSCHRFLR